MALVLLVGFPCSGKSLRAKEFHDFLSGHPMMAGKVISVVADEDYGWERNAYADARMEKDLRNTIKSEISRRLYTKEILILDSMNYIKGFRYELFCIARETNSVYGVIFCDVPEDIASGWNTQREEDARYSEEVFLDLIERMEFPNPKNKWESPMAVAQMDKPLDVETLFDDLFMNERSRRRPVLATSKVKLEGEDYKYRVTKVSQSIIDAIFEKQSTGLFSGYMPYSRMQLRLTKKLPYPELNRHKLRFTKVILDEIGNGLVKPEADEDIGDLFIAFLEDVKHGR